jgi:hypothetical protein
LETVVLFHWGDAPMAFDKNSILERFDRHALSFTYQDQRIEILCGLGESDVGICDLAELQKMTGKEHALLKWCGEGSHVWVIIRGAKHRCWIPPEFPEHGFVWYAHSHPYDDPKPSDADRHALSEVSKLNGQEVSVVVPESQKCAKFGSSDDLSGYKPYEPSNVSDMWEEHFKQ